MSRENQRKIVPLEQPVQKAAARRAQKAGNAGAQPNIHVKIEERPAVELFCQEVGVARIEYAEHIEP